MTTRVARSAIAYAADLFGFDALERAAMTLPLSELAAVAIEAAEQDERTTIIPPATETT